MLPVLFFAPLAALKRVCFEDLDVGVVRLYCASQPAPKLGGGNGLARRGRDRTPPPSPECACPMVGSGHEVVDKVAFRATY